MQSCVCGTDIQTLPWHDENALKSPKQGVTWLELPVRWACVEGGGEEKGDYREGGQIGGAVTAVQARGADGCLEGREGEE